MTQTHVPDGVVFDPPCSPVDGLGAWFYEDPAPRPEGAPSPAHLHASDWSPVHVDYGPTVGLVVNEGGVVAKTVLDREQAAHLRDFITRILDAVSAPVVQVPGTFYVHPTPDGSRVDHLSFTPSASSLDYVEWEE